VRVLTVPAAAVVERAGLVGVFVVDKDHRAHFRLVRTGQSRNGQVAVAAGLAAGEMVIARPTADLVNDRLVEPGAAAPKAAGTDARRD
jgi:hypothetical protein